MLNELVAEYFGVENDENLAQAVSNSGINILDWLEDTQEVRQRVIDAMNKQTDVMVEAAMNDPVHQEKLMAMLMELSQVPGITVSGMPNRAFRRRTSKKKYRA